MEVEGSDGKGAKNRNKKKTFRRLLQKSSPEMTDLDRRQSLWLGWLWGGNEREK